MKGARVLRAERKLREVEVIDAALRWARAEKGSLYATPKNKAATDEHMEELLGLLKSRARTLLVLSNDS